MNRRHFLKMAAIGGAALAATTYRRALAATYRHAVAAESKDKPNFIIIFIDVY